jgi:hypothetical protein
VGSALSNDAAGFFTLACQTYKLGYWFFWLNVLCSVLGKTLARTTGFLLLAEHKPCYVRAMEICSTFSSANPMNMVAWGRIELPTRGFSKHVAPKTSMFMGVAA